MHSSLRLRNRTLLALTPTPITLAPHQLSFIHPHTTHSHFPLLSPVLSTPKAFAPPHLRFPHHPNMSHLFDRLLTTYSKVSDALSFNAATLSGAIDIIVIHHSDDTYTSTPFHVRFGKLQLLKSREKLVTIHVNGVECEWKMKLGHAGEAFFVLDADKQQPASEEELSSPTTSPSLSPAALLTTQGTITPIQPQPHARQKSDNSRTTDEYKFPEPLDLSHNTLSPPPVGTPRGLKGVEGHGRSVSEAGVEGRRGVVLSLGRRLKEEEDERTVGEDRRKEGDEELDAEMMWTLQHESKEEISNAVRLTRQCFSAPLSPHSPRSPRSPSSVLTPQSSDLTSEQLPPSLRLRSTLSMDPTLFSPASPHTPSSPLSNNGDRQLSAPSASDAREHTWQWTWGHLPVHHQRFHPNGSDKAEQVIHSARVGMSPSGSIVLTPTGGAASLPPSPRAAAIELKGDVVRELQHEAAAAAASLAHTGTGSGSSSMATTPVDSRSWSVRGIFSSVFSKLPARSSFSLPYGGGGAEPSGTVTTTDGKEEPTLPTLSDTTPASDIASPPTTNTTAVPPTSATHLHSSIAGSTINLAEAHLPVPWLNKMDTEKEDTVSSPLTSSSIPSPTNQPPQLTARSPPSAFASTLPSSPSVSHTSDVLTSPLSAPLPSASSPSSSSTFSLPSQARPASAMEGSLLRPHHTSNLSVGLSLDTAPSPSNLTHTTPPSPSLSSLDPSLLRLSLCGHYLGSNADLNRSLFEQHSISYDQLASQPELTFRSDLVILYQQRLYPSRIALPLVLSHLAYGRPLAITQEGLDRLGGISLPLPPLMGTGPGGEGSATKKIEQEDGGRSWRDWFRSKKPPPIDTVSDMPTRNEVATSLSATQPRTAEPLDGEGRPSLSHSQSMEVTTSDESDTLTPHTITVSSPNFSPTAPPSASPSQPPRSFIKSLRPTSAMLNSLGLRQGRNQVTFTVSSSLQGQQSVSSSIYLWPPTVKIVISDIDGTITKSDVLGHVMPLVGRDWSHLGVTQLYSDIHRNGYQLLYLTSRAIGQANITRGYIHKLRQGESSLPYGPVIMSPDRLLHSFKREVIDRRPQEFKIVALRDVKGLFDDDINPFAAGFGNRITDVVAYRAVGVPASRIFIINPHGVIQHINVNYSKSYPELSALVNSMFPSILDGKKGEAEFNNANFWRAPLPPLSDDDVTDSESEEEEEEDGSEDSEEERVNEVVHALSGKERKEAQEEAAIITKPKVVATV